MCWRVHSVLLFPHSERFNHLERKFKERCQCTRKTGWIKSFILFAISLLCMLEKKACAKAHCILLIIWRSPHQYSDFNSFTSRRFYMVISISTMSIQLQICSINIEINEFVSILRLRVHWLVSFTRHERFKKVFCIISLSRNGKDQVLSDFTSNSIEFVRAPL